MWEANVIISKPDIIHVQATMLQQIKYLFRYNTQFCNSDTRQALPFKRISKI